MNLLKPLAIISSITLFSRILGFIRDTILAQIFGASVVSDAFFTAFKIPNLLRRIFAEGAVSQVFIPILAEYKNQRGNAATRTFIAYITGLLTLVLVLITVAGILIAPWIIMTIAPGFNDTLEKFTLTTALLRITFPYILLISLASLGGVILNTWNNFLVPSFTPALLNISMIGFVLLAAPLFHPPIMALAWSVMIGGIFQLGYQLPYLKKIGMLVLPRIPFSFNIEIWRVLRQIGPAILGMSVSQVSLIINTIFTSFLVSGSVSWMYYADRLMELPSGVLGVALGTILLPSLSRSISEGNYKEYSYLLNWGLRICFIIALPSAVGLGILARPLIVVLFQYGNFSTIDTVMTQRALVSYSVGLVGLILVKVLTPGFYSRQDIKTPIYAAMITLLTTQLMNLTFIGPLQHAGLALSISLSACINAAILYWQLHRQKLLEPQPGWLKFFCWLLLAVMIMAVTLIGLLIVIPDWSQGCLLWRLLRLIIVIMVGIIIYCTTLWIVGFRPHHFTRSTYDN